MTDVRPKDEVIRVEDDAAVFGGEGSLVPHPHRFDPGDAACLSRAVDGAVRFRLTTEPDVSDARVTVRTDDGILSHAMALELEGTVLRVWSLALEVPDGAEYSLAYLDGRGDPVYLTNAGIAGGVERLDRWVLDLDAIPVVDVPVWAQGAIIYQVFPDRFANGDTANDPEGVDEWGAEPRRDGFQGGDLPGVEEHLDHLQALGVDILYLNPVVTSPSNHRYDASDFHHVDPMLGGDEAFHSLRRATRERGMRLMVDLSLNHCHPRHAAFADIVERGAESPFWDWFDVTEWPLQVRYRPDRAPEGFSHFGDLEAASFTDETGIPFVRADDDGPFVETTYDSWYGVPTMPRFDLTNEEARAYLLGVGSHWLGHFDADAIRMDVARYIELDVWREARPVFRDVKEDAFLLCEIFGDASRWLQGDTFDGVMNYVGRHILLGFVGSQDVSGAEVLAAYERLAAAYTPEALLASQALLGSHDTPRFLTAVGGDHWRLELATALSLLLPGAPGIYYGDEVYLDGGHDPECRKAFPWGAESSSALVETIAELSALRNRRPELRTGGWRPLAAEDDWLAFERGSGADKVRVVANKGPAPVEAPVEATEVLWGPATLRTSTVTVAPRSVAVLA